MQHTSSYGAVWAPKECDCVFCYQVFVTKFLLPTVKGPPPNTTTPQRVSLLQLLVLTLKDPPLPISAVASNSNNVPSSHLSHCCLSGGGMAYGIGQLLQPPHLVGPHMVLPLPVPSPIPPEADVSANASSIVMMITTIPITKHPHSGALPTWHDRQTTHQYTRPRHTNAPSPSLLGSLLLHVSIISLPTTPTS